MSKVFGDYSKFYDLLYRDKNYATESKFVTDIIRQRVPNATNILNIGCGTGKHDGFFAEAGFTVTGIDLSEEMLEIARLNNKGPHFNYLRADARSFSINQKFDAVVSLFHVFSYQNLNCDARSFLNTIRDSLSPEGVGIFDYWHAPAVVHQKPINREKVFASAELEIVRSTQSTTDYAKSLVEVNFDFRIKNLVNSELRSFKEQHRMRFFSCNEVEVLAEDSGLRAQHYAWMTNNREPGIDDWSAFTVVTPE